MLPDLGPANEVFQAATALIDPGDDMENYLEETEALADVEGKITRLSDLAIFMAAIEAEDAINQFAVFNVHKDAAGAIEKLSPG